MEVSMRHFFSMHSVAVVCSAFASIHLIDERLMQQWREQFPADIWDEEDFYAA
jgi:hypothetical protein